MDEHPTTKLARYRVEEMDRRYPGMADDVMTKIARRLLALEAVVDAARGALPVPAVVEFGDGGTGVGHIIPDGAMDGLRDALTALDKLKEGR